MFKPVAATLLVTLALLAGGRHAAADGSGSLVVRGTVPAVCTVEILATGAKLDLTGGAKNVTVGRVTETCNDPGGYTVTFASEGRGALVNGTARVDYTVTYDTAQNISLAQELDLKRKSAAFGETRDLRVSVSGAADRVAGDYTDTITVTIAAR